jgi:hypothetical protein
MNSDIAIRQPQHTFADLERMAKAVAGSGLFGTKTVEQALTLMLLAQAEGLHPAIAARDYHIIEGRPSLKADTMLARFLGAGGKVEWHTLTAEKAEATFSAPGAQPLRMDWTIEQARTAGLVRNNRDGSPGTWMRYPRPLLRSRLISEAIRTVMPQVIAGIHTPEELLDEPELRDVTPPRDTPTDPGKPAQEITEAELVDKETVEIKSAARTEQPTLELSGDQQQPETQMDEKALHDHLANIDAAATLDELKTAHAKAYTAAHAAGDGKALLRFEVAKKAQKYRLTKTGAP